MNPMGTLETPATLLLVSMTFLTLFRELHRSVTSRPCAVLQRNSRFVALIAGVGCLAIVGTVGGEAGAQTTLRTRTVFFDTFPITDKLHTDDEVVIVEMRADEAVTDKSLSGLAALRSAARRRTAIVATVDVAEVRGESALDGAWVHTVFRGTVAQVHRIGPDVDRRHRIRNGERIEFHVSGGEINVRNVIVRAQPVIPFPASRQYIVFLSGRQGEQGLNVTATPLLVDGENLVAVASANSSMAGLTLGDLRRAVRR
ncbi:hypothetical protein [Luteitalea sp.]|uniref:hypothetical protein n=1 Tax=Luteitalea sp. TaxID=2004800 RepID=UPI0025C2B6DA|nr:hypothetical protein [Luteitalea sp.]